MTVYEAIILFKLMEDVEVDHLFAGFSATEGAPEVVAITPSRYDVASGSVYALA